jgi:hypothetical protein
MMKGLARGLTTMVLAIAAAACDGSPTAGSAFLPESGGIAAAQQPGSSTLTFSSSQSYDTQSPQTASGGVGSIDFTGSLTTSTPCHTVTASHTDRRGNITVTVSAASTGGICTQVITNNNYTGRVSGLAAGTYNFTVVHQGGLESGTAYSSTVTVQ